MGGGHDRSQASGGGSGEMSNTEGGQSPGPIYYPDLRMKGTGPKGRGSSTPSGHLIDFRKTR